MNQNIFCPSIYCLLFYDDFEETKEENRDMGGVHRDDSMISFNNLFIPVVQKKTT